MVRDVVTEYEAKIKLMNDNETLNKKRLEDQIQLLESEKDRLTKALELNCDRSFFTKLMYG
jgi:uncharacterized protein Yka (UPF0111/DUF47 family)